MCSPISGGSIRGTAGGREGGGGGPAMIRHAPSVAPPFSNSNDDIAKANRQSTKYSNHSDIAVFSF